MLSKPYTDQELQKKRQRVRSKGPLLHAPPTSLAPLSINEFFTQFFEEVLIKEKHEPPKPSKRKLPHTYRPAIPQDEWEALRSAVMIRDNLICITCGGWADLGVHHMDYDKTNNDPDNLETLCWPCHTTKHH